MDMRRKLVGPFKSFDISEDSKDVYGVQFMRDGKHEWCLLVLSSI